MSFFDIADPVKREQVFQEYKKLKEDIREKSENNRNQAFEETLALEKRYAPIVKSQREMTDKIVKELKMENREEDKEEEENKPIKDEVKDEKLDGELGNGDDLHSGHFAEEYKRRYALRDEDIDIEFGIRFLDDGRAVIGQTPITIQGDDIVIGGEVYHGNAALWELITEKKKENLTHMSSYTQDDWNNYYDIIKRTNVLRRNFDPNSSKSRSNKSWKWKEIFSDFWKRMKEEDNSSGDENDGKGDGSESSSSDEEIDE